jgi:release factor glutamine methyltransferase
MRISSFKIRKYISTYLSKNGIVECDAEARFIMDHLDETYVSISNEYIKEAIKILRERIKRKPIHYIIGYKYFYGLKFHLNDSCLIPRFDSECIVEYCINYAKSLGGSVSILDLFCGSGCLGISLLHETQKDITVDGTFVDIQDECLDITRENSSVLTSRVKQLKLDLSKDESYNIGRNFDIIISNPPYIPSHEVKTLSLETSVFEPKISLDGGGDGLYFYRILAKNISKLMHKNSLYITEIGDNQESDVINIFSDYRFASYVKDLTGKIRAVAFMIQ